MILASLFQLDHPSGLLRLSTLPVDFTDPEGREWIGGAAVLSVNPYGAATGLDGGSLVIQWNAFDAALMALARHPGILRADFRSWLVEIDDTQNPPVRSGAMFAGFAGLCEIPEIDANPAAGTITLTVQSPLLDLGRTRTVMLSAKAQKEIDPDDTGADFVSMISQRPPDLRA